MLVFWFAFQQHLHTVFHKGSWFLPFKLCLNFYLCSFYNYIIFIITPAVDRFSWYLSSLCWFGFAGNTNTVTTLCFNTISTPQLFFHEKNIIARLISTNITFILFATINFFFIFIWRPFNTILAILWKKLIFMHRNYHIPPNHVILASQIMLLRHNKTNNKHP